VEYLGADRLIYGTLIGDFSDQKVIARLPATVTAKIAPGKSYDFAVQQSELRFFDKSTELRILPQPI
jgi:multiple sugar transport system ATP-binding protein